MEIQELRARAAKIRDRAFALLARRGYVLSGSRVCYAACEGDRLTAKDMLDRAAGFEASADSLQDADEA